MIPLILLTLAAPPTESVTAARKGCKKNQATSCLSLANRFATGSGVTADLTRALSLYKKACKTGEAGGCIAAGRLLHDGTLGKRNEAAAVSFFERGCAAKHGRSCLELGLAHADVDEQLRALKRSCSLEVGVACGHAGLLTGKRGDAAAAATLFGRGCTFADPASCTALGRAHLDGNGVAADAGIAGKFLERACKLEHMEGCAELGAIYLKGRPGLLADPDRGKQLLKTACDNGVPSACSQLW